MAFVVSFTTAVSHRKSHDVRCHHAKRLRAATRQTSTLMSFSGPADDGGKGKEPEPAKIQSHVSAEFAMEAVRDAITEAEGDICAMARKCAFGFVEAFVQCYSKEDAPAVFVVCGPGLNGVIGVQVALELKSRGYEPAVYAADKSKYINISAICEERGIDLYDFIPSTLEFYFQVVVDALLGIGFDGGDIRPMLWSVYEMLVSTRLAVVSLDVPSGWDLHSGPREIDVTADTFVKPEVLVSLGAPKNGSKMFAGGYHFLAGRHLPQQYFIDRGITVPLYPGEDAHCVLISSNPFRFQGNTGEVYGRPGQFNATLFTKNPKREWVDVDEEMDLWDELD